MNFAHLYRTEAGRRIHHEIGTSSWHVGLPGTRLTLWIGGMIVLAAAGWARRDLRRAVTEGQIAPRPVVDGGIPATPINPPPFKPSGGGDPAPAG